MTTFNAALLIFLLSSVAIGGALISLFKRSWRSRGFGALKVSLAAFALSFGTMLATTPPSDPKSNQLISQTTPAVPSPPTADKPDQSGMGSSPAIEPRVERASASAGSPQPLFQKAAEARPFSKAELQLDLPAILADCPVSNESCLASQQKFRDEYVSAFKKRYTSQRNVAFMLEDRAHGQIGVVHNWIAACAWRAVIMNSRHPEVDDGDRSNLAYACRRLNPPGKAAAAIMAGELMGKIYQRPLATGFMFP